MHDVKWRWTQSTCRVVSLDFYDISQITAVPSFCKFDYAISACYIIQIYPLDSQMDTVHRKKKKPLRGLKHKRPCRYTRNDMIQGMRSEHKKNSKRKAVKLLVYNYKRIHCAFFEYYVIWTWCLLPNYRFPKEISIQFFVEYVCQAIQIINGNHLLY